MERGLPVSPVDFEVLARVNKDVPSGILQVYGVTPQFLVYCPMTYRVLVGEGTYTNHTIGKTIAEGDELSFPWGFPVRFSGIMRLMFQAELSTQIGSAPFDEYPPEIVPISTRQSRDQSWIWSGFDVESDK